MDFEKSRPRFPISSKWELASKCSPSGHRTVVNVAELSYISMKSDVESAMMMAVRLSGKIFDYNRLRQVMAPPKRDGLAYLNGFNI